MLTTDLIDETDAFDATAVLDAGLVSDFTSACRPVAGES